MGAPAVSAGNAPALMMAKHGRNTRTHAMTTMLLFTVIFSPRFSVLAAEFGIEYALDAAAVAYVTQQCGCVNVTLN